MKILSGSKKVNAFQNMSSGFHFKRTVRCCRTSAQKCFRAEKLDTLLRDIQGPILWKSAGSKAGQKKKPDRFSVVSLLNSESLLNGQNTWSALRKAGF